jgi:hypothetical protein
VRRAFDMFRGSDIAFAGSPGYDSALWHRRKGRLVRRLLHIARRPSGSESASHSNAAASCSCAFLLSNGAPACSFPTATPP